MRKINRLTFQELVKKNKEELLSDKKAFDILKDKFETKLEEKMLKN